MAVLLVAVNVAGCAAVHRDGTSHPRDPETGFMQGGEPARIDRGRSRACLLLHGWLGTPAALGSLPKALDEAGWDVHAPLHAGHGTRPAALKGVGAGELLQHARERYEAIRSRYETVALVGFSMGGTIATILAAERPPDRLVLISPYYRVRHKWFYVLPAHWWQAVLGSVLWYVPRGGGFVHVNRKENRDKVVRYTAFPTSASRALFALGRKALRSDLSPLKMPVLLVHSTGDEVCSPAAMKRVLERMPSQQKRKAVFSRSDHHVLLDYDAEAAVGGIVDFLEAR